MKNVEQTSVWNSGQANKENEKGQMQHIWRRVRWLSRRTSSCVKNTEKDAETPKLNGTRCVPSRMRPMATKPYRAMFKSERRGADGRERRQRNREAKPAATHRGGTPAKSKSINRYVYIYIYIYIQTGPGERQPSRQSQPAQG